ncbi:hypothetical protein SAMN05216191_12345 [Paenibacillus jilunlii]|uniref:Adenylate kinase n=1 Tax=Paenibacillus jilunlii TaxID=682956 RepID=A0A1G9XWS0_9BACL|nr:hypothetical protein SAMN05216191_12345 [Paenibacillus jilunlii]
MPRSNDHGLRIFSLWKVRKIRIRIIGGCGSGKSYTARELSKRYGVPYFETDNFVWDRSTPYCRNTPEVRDAQLAEIVAMDSWIIEGVHYKWGSESFRQADFIVLIRPNRVTQDWRVVRRFVKTRLGLEQGNYKQTFRNLNEMLFKWNRKYVRADLPRIMELTEEYRHKRIIVKNNQEILQWFSLYNDLVETGANVPVQTER